MLKALLFFYCFILVAFITIGAASSNTSLIPFLSFLPVSLYFLVVLLGKFKISRGAKIPFGRSAQPFFLYYSFVVVALMSVIGLAGANTIPQFVSAVVFLPIVFQLILSVLPKKKKAFNIPMIVVRPEELEQEADELEIYEEKKPRKLDFDRRQFLKIIGSGGLVLFMFSIFTKKSEAAFFGSSPAVGTVAIKDTAGVVVDPAIKTPTDGYKITELDASDPAYYGFVEKTGKWFIMKEDSGAFRYVKGDNSFSANWTNRASLVYDYFDVVF